MGPYRRPHPLPLFHDLRVGLLDEGAHPCQRIASPVTQLGNPFADSFRGRLARCPCLTLHLPAFRWRCLANRGGTFTSCRPARAPTPAPSPTRSRQPPRPPAPPAGSRPIRRPC